MRQFGLLLALAFSVHAAEPDFTREVQPILAKRCSACHGAGQQMAGLRLDSGAAILKGSKSGVVVTPGNSTKSRLLERVSSNKPGFKMPPAGVSLSEAEIARRWSTSIVDENVRLWASTQDGLPALGRGNVPSYGCNLDAGVAANLFGSGFEGLPPSGNDRQIDSVSCQGKRASTTEPFTRCAHDGLTSGYAEIHEVILRWYILYERE
jgi:hypothetical protein